MTTIINIDTIVTKIFDKHICSIVYSPKNNQFATGSVDKTIKIWDSQDSEIFECRQTLSGHKDMVRSLCYNHNGLRIASGSDDKTIKIWNTKTFECIQTLIGHNSGIESVLYILNGTKIQSGSYEK